MSLLIMALAISMTAGAYPAGYYNQRSRLSAGKWVKIRVTQEGIQQISYEQLRSWGFEDPRSVTVYGYGGTSLTGNTFDENLPDDLTETPTIHTDDDRLLFYGVGDLRVVVQNSASVNIFRNTYSSSGYYFISDTGTSAKIPVIDYKQQSRANASGTHMHLEYIEEEIQNPAKAGAFFFGESMIPGTAQEFKFPVKDFAKAGAYISSTSTTTNIFFRYEFIAKASENTILQLEYPLNVNISYRTDQPAPAVYSSTKCYSTGYGYARFTLGESSSEGDTEISIKASLPTESKALLSAIDRAYMLYPRENALGNNPELIMNFLSANTGKNFIVKDATERTMAWNINDPTGIFAYNGKFDNTTGEFSYTFDKEYSSKSGSAKIIAFDPAAQHHEVEYAGQVENQNIHGDDVPVMVIITNTGLMQQARELADAHERLQGIRVNVYNQDEIFNEFSSGTPCAMAYRRMAKMFYDRDPLTFRYILLYGTGCWDNRGITVPNRDYLIAYEVERIEEARESSTNYTNDAYFGMLSDTYDPSAIEYEISSVAVGRIPVKSATVAAEINRKLTGYMSNPPKVSTFNHALLLSDDGDRNIHMTQSNEIADSLVRYNPSSTVTKAYNLIYPWDNQDARQARESIIQSLEQGQGYFCYTGHGDSNSFTAENMWTKKHVTDTGYRCFPFAMLSTCNAFAFDRLDDGIAEAMLAKEDGGMIAIIAACRTVYLEYNQTFNLAVAKAYASATQGTTAGDIFIKARNEMISSPETESARAVNTLCYNLCGDPAIPIKAPIFSIAVTSMDGIPVTAGDTYTIHPLVPIKIKGQVNNVSGEKVSTFNGTAELEIFDGPHTVKTSIKNKNDITDSILDVSLDQDLLAKVTTYVTDGEFETTVCLPAPLVPGVSNRMVVTAESSDRHISATGTFNQFVVADFDPDLVKDDITSSVPVIENMYIDTPSFADGDAVSGSFNLHADIRASASGINTATGTIGSGTVLMLDGCKSYPQANNTIAIDASGIANIDLPVSGLSGGNHRFDLSVADNAGNRAISSISFVVSDNMADAELSTDENPARQTATLRLTHRSGDTPAAHLIIEDMSGNTILSRENVSFPFSWDLCDKDGNPVKDGYYTSFAILHSDNVYGSTPRCMIIVIR